MNVVTGVFNEFVYYSQKCDAKQTGWRTVRESGYWQLRKSWALHGKLGQVFITVESVKSRSSIYSLGDLHILTFPSSSFYHHCIHSLSQWDQSKPVDFSVSTEYKTSLSSYWLDLWPGVVPTSITASSSPTKILISSLLCCVTETSGLRWLSVLC